MDRGEEERETTYKRAVRLMKVFLSPWICNPRVFEVKIYNPPYRFGSQTLILRNGGLQIHRDRILDYGDEWMEERKKERQRTRELLGL